MLIAILTSGLTFLIQNALGLVPSGDTWWKWIAILLGQGVGYLVVVACLFCHAAWKEDEHKTKQIATLRAKARDLVRLAEAETLFHLMVRMAVPLSAATDHPLAETDDPATTTFQAVYGQYLILRSHFNPSVRVNSLFPLPEIQESGKNKEEMQAAFTAYKEALTAYQEQLRGTLLEDPRLL